MKILVLILLLIPFYSLAESDERLCLEFLGLEENDKKAHKNKHCLAAAKNGSGAALYSIGAGYGYEGNKSLEQAYYQLAASKNVAAAYLALGHSYQGTNKEKAIAWYIRYANTKVKGYGYGAYLVAKIYRSRGDTGKANYWLSICKGSPFGPNCAE